MREYIVVYTKLDALVTQFIAVPKSLYKELIEAGNNKDACVIFQKYIGGNYQEYKRNPGFECNFGEEHPWPYTHDKIKGIFNLVEVY